MSIEIERKFLVVGEAWREQAHRRIHMDQGYLVPPGGKASVRVRLTDEEARLNIKASVVGAERAEYDYPVPLADGREMLETLCVARLSKTRHLLGVEVTEDLRYYNHSLAVNPYRRWAESSR